METAVTFLAIICAFRRASESERLRYEGLSKYLSYKAGEGGGKKEVLMRGRGRKYLGLVIR